MERVESRHDITQPTRAGDGLEEALGFLEGMTARGLRSVTVSELLAA